MRLRDYQQGTHPPHEAGFSLIELLVAMALGVVLSWGVISFLQDSLQSSRTAISSSNMQDIAQVALETIKKDVRMAGFRGECVPSSTEATTGSAISQFYSVMGEEGAGTTSDRLHIYTADIQDEALYLWSYSRATDELTVCTNPNTADADGVLPSCAPTEFETTELFLLSDCQSWAVFNPDRKSSSDTTLSSKFKPAQSPTLSLNDYLLPGTSSEDKNVIETTSTYVLYKVGSNATSGATEYQIIQDTNPQHALRSGAQPSILFRNGEPLVYGVENLQILYGRSVGGKIQYTPGCSAADLADQNACNTALAGTTHLRISLIIQSDQRTEGATAQAFNIANPAGRNTYNAPADGRLRRVYTSTIQLRNMF